VVAHDIARPSRTTCFPQRRHHFSRTGLLSAMSKIVVTQFKSDQLFVVQPSSGSPCSGFHIYFSIDQLAFSVKIIII
jgi:hypothetical protein